jgi:hypothetical protein
MKVRGGTLGGETNPHPPLSLAKGEAAFARGTFDSFRWWELKTASIMKSVRRRAFGVERTPRNSKFGGDAGARH